MEDVKWKPVSEEPTETDWYLVVTTKRRKPEVDIEPFNVKTGWHNAKYVHLWMPLPEIPDQMKLK